MYLKFSDRFCPTTNTRECYYRLVESYRNEDNRICHKTLYNIGFWPGFTTDEQIKILDKLNDLYKRQLDMFVEEDPKIDAEVQRIWNIMVSKKKIDRKIISEQAKMVHVETIKHNEVREIGTEWLCYNTWNKLGLTEFFTQLGWTEEQIQLAQTQVISRAIYPVSELASTRIIKENSAICSLTNYDKDKITKDKLYAGALSLYKHKTAIERHLSKRTNDLFDLQDKIILYDLTNTYFEGRKTDSLLAKFGRSKERRSDAKLVVLAMVVNLEGFIKYSSIHEGNYSDTSDITKVIEHISRQAKTDNPIIVLDAGIATNDNIRVIEEMKYKFVVVSRAKVKDYKIVEGCVTKQHTTKSNGKIQLTLIENNQHKDYYLKVESTAKNEKEKAMKNRFEAGYLMELNKISAALNKKNGVKLESKVMERIGRAKEKYPSIHNLYNIKYEVKDNSKIVTSMQWTKDPLKDTESEQSLGTYFIRTNLESKDETMIWNIYNSIVEIEASFRCLKTDLDLRPIYHKNDDATMAHLHLGILAYWLVNTIRHQLKQCGINNDWKEIKRIASTQKQVSSSAQNTFDEIIHIQKCSEPNDKLKALHKILKIASKPFKKFKSVVHKPPHRKNEILYHSRNTT